jgi:FkbM family methyltransferase
MNFNGYNQEDKYLLENCFWGQTGRFFLEVGAHDGLYGSDTLIFEREFGWSGILIEPVPEMFQTLKANRKGPCVQVCLAGNRREVTFRQPPDSRFSSIKDGHLSKWDMPTKRSVTMETKLLADVLKECGAPSVIDLWVFDIEGAEDEVIATFPFNEYRFNVIVVEKDHTDMEVVTKTLEANKYVKTVNIGWDTVFRHAGFVPSVKPSSMK